MEDGLLSLKWNNHKKTFLKSIETFRNKALYTDVTLVCEDKYFSVHKLVLSACSEYFQNIFSKIDCKCPVIIIKGVRQHDLEYLLQYAYLGEVEVKQTDLPELIKAAECLQIKGLASPDEDEESPKKRKRSSEEMPSNINKQRKLSPKIQSHIESKADLQTNSPKDPIEFVKLEPEDSELIDINTKLEYVDKTEIDYDNVSENIVEKNQVSYEEGEATTSFIDTGDPSISDEHMPEYDIAGQSGISEDILAADCSLAEESGGDQESMDSSTRITKNRSRNDIQVFRCLMCDYITHNKGSMIVHDRKHTGEKPYQCEFCDYRATQKHHIIGHRRRHTGEKPYQCEYCDYRASQISTINRHRRTHTGEKPFACIYCPYRTARKGLLASHMLAIHGVSDSSIHMSDSTIHMSDPAIHGVPDNDTENAEN